MKRFVLLLAVLLLPGLAIGGTTKDRMKFEGPVTMSGATTLSGATTISGAVIKPYTLDTVTVTLTSADCGETHAIATDAKIYNLPPTVAGCELTFINAGAAANNLLTINPDDADQIFGTVTLAGSVVAIVGAAGDAVSNTKGTSIRGDSMTLIADGTDGWYIVGSTGIWADIN